jgi:hypothetical protein
LYLFKKDHIRVYVRKHFGDEVIEKQGSDCVKRASMREFFEKNKVPFSLLKTHLLCLSPHSSFSRSGITS